MSVWFAIPSVREPDVAMGCIGAWQRNGYRVAVLRDAGAPGLPVDLCVHGKFNGYGAAVNMLTRMVFAGDEGADWIVTGGDDLWPDVKAAPERIAAECTEYFGGTLGIMQPTGDRHIEREGRCSAERVCVSPWIGRRFAERGYGGRGAFCEEYWHYFVDEELHNVASAAGLLWHRADLCQYHGWWKRAGAPELPHLVRARADWNAARDLHCRRQAAGYPGNGQGWGNDR